MDQASHEDRVRDAVRRFSETHGTHPDQADESTRRKEWGRLEAVRRKKGFKPGWSWWQYKNLFGEGPPDRWQTETAESYDEATERGGSVERAPTMATMSRDSEVIAKAITLLDGETVETKKNFVAAAHRGASELVRWCVEFVEYRKGASHG